MAARTEPVSADSGLDKRREYDSGRAEQTNPRAKVKKLNEKVSAQKQEIMDLKKENITWESRFNTLRESHNEFKKEVV